MSAFPSISPNGVEWQLISNTQSFTSPLDKTVQTLELPGARWMATLSFNNLTDADARILLAFLAALRGQSGRFTMHDHSHPTPSGIATGTPLVAGASQTGGTLVTDGWTPSQTGILKAGDYLGVNGELHMVIADADSDVSGNATFSIEPPLRASPADNAAITVNSPTATFRLMDDGQARWKATPGYINSMTISCIESFT